MLWRWILYIETDKTNNLSDGKYPKKGFCVSTRRLFKYYKIAELR